ncbi:histone-fold-containing protein [Scheffersomyces coipomensis]|uniref:histone-fold-containing protein n=2 Tax=Scheffersomyces TaxID=766733 RepID=UPI00315DB2BD
MERYENNYLDEEDLSSHLQQQPQQPQPPIVEEAELLAAQAAAEAAAAQQQRQPGGAFNNVGQGLTGKHRDMMMQYWQETINSIEHDDHDFKNHQLPLARIKKVMKTDEDVRMISAEAPILFAKGCDVFITELTMRAWIHAEENKRRTLQKSDIAAALTKSDMFDFLIDVVPREEEKPKKAAYTSSRTNSYVNNNSNNHHNGSINEDSNDIINGNGVIPEDSKGEENNESHPVLKQENDDALHQRLFQEQLLQQQLLQQQQQQQQAQSQSQVQPQPQPQSQPPSQPPSIEQSNSSHIQSSTNGNIQNGNRDENFQNFQEFNSTAYTAEY